MRFSEFNRLLNRRSNHDQIEMLIPLADLQIFHPTNNKLIKLVKDCRSVEIEGRWHIQPIALSRTHVFIVCPYCHEIHLHGNANGFYEGVRVPHCNMDNLRNNYKIIRPMKGNMIYEKCNQK